MLGRLGRAKNVDVHGPRLGRLDRIAQFHIREDEVDVRKSPGGFRRKHALITRQGAVIGDPEGSDQWIGRLDALKEGFEGGLAPILIVENRAWRMEVRIPAMPLRAPWGRHTRLKHL